MSEVPHPGAPPTLRRFIYAGAVIILIALLIWGLFAFDGIKDDREAHAKAEKLAGELGDAGLPAPSASSIADTLGTDGGFVCADPDSALAKARYRAGQTNGASGPGSRPVISDEDAAQAETLVISVYCPDKLGSFTKQVRQHKYDNTTK